MNLVNYVKLAIIAAFLAGSASIYASGIEKLMQFTAPGTMGNLNKPAVIKDQQGGYLTGGSLILRGPQPKELQPLTVQTPRFAFDPCTGSADFRFGGLSFVSSKEFLNQLKSTVSAAGAYGLKMYLKTICPQCENVVMDLEAITRDINGLTMSQCSAAQKIAGGAVFALSNAEKQSCMLQSNIRGESKDMYEAADKCVANPKRYGDLGRNDEMKSVLGSEFNLVWKALTQNAGAGDKAFKELIMSVSGTVIGIREGDRLRFAAKSSLALTGDLLESYVGSASGDSKVKLYSCDTPDKCLNPKIKEVTLKAEETLYGNVARIMRGLIDKVLNDNDNALTDEERALISFSSIPLINLIETENMNKSRSNDALVRSAEFIEVVCYDLMTNFLLQATNRAAEAVESLRFAQLVDLKPVEEFTSSLERVQSSLRSAKFSAFKRLQIVTQVKERLKQQERAFEEGFSRYIGTLD